MLKKNGGAQRVYQGPQPRDFLPTALPSGTAGRSRVDKPKREPAAPVAVEREKSGKALNSETGRGGKSLRPEPRIPGKNALNPPIVTIFGAGVAGLTAAQELVERGFIVQVIEEKEDPYCPGRPVVGGMAANQASRVRANVEDLHRDLMVLAFTPKGNSEGSEVDVQRRVASWLLKMFAFNRSRWIQTEEPFQINGCLFSDPTTTGGKAFKKTLFKKLHGARGQYRERWLWDLIIRGVLLRDIRPDDKRVNANHEAERLFTDLQKEDSAKLADRLFTYLRTASPSSPADLPTEADLQRCVKTVAAAFEREFLCFKLVPYARRGFEEGPDRARKLYAKWIAAFSDDPILASCCISCPPPDAPAAPADPNQVPLDGDGLPIVVESADASPEFPYMAWLQVEIVEQRLPGEHGYRFFPSFYRHLDDTMSRIPLYLDGVPTGRTVRDNLRPTLFQGIGLSTEDVADLVAKRATQRRGYLEKADPGQRVNYYQNYDDPMPDACSPKAIGTVVELHRERPDSVEAFRDCTDRFVKRLGGTTRDAVLLLAKFLRFMTTSPERRRKEYESISWSTFLKIDDFSEPMKFQILSAAQALLAFSASEADARTYGNVAVQMLLDQLKDGTRVDRTLNGPTSDAWLEPWRDYLERQGVRFFCGALNGLTLSATSGELVPDIAISEKNRVSEVATLLTDESTDPALQPDFYVLALNIERTRDLINAIPADPVAAGATDFVALDKFATQVRELNALKNMTGLQYFFDSKTDIGHGHMYFPYSPWGLSSISQSEFWSARGGFADGYFGVLSVDVCTTESPTPDEAGQAAGGASFSDTLKAGEAEGRERRCYETALNALNQLKPRLGAAANAGNSNPAAEMAPGSGDPLRALSDPRCFHIDRNQFPPREGSPDGANPRFLASLAKMDTDRPGRSQDGCVGAKEIEYSVNFGRWVVCGSFMATHTRMTTMEAANESARHAVSAILNTLSTEDALPDLKGQYAGHGYEIENLTNAHYNWASNRRTYEPPEIWNLEDDELADLDFFRRVDRRLFNLDLPHFMDIMNFDRKLEHALDALDIYGEERPLSEIFGAATASFDAAFTKELGQGYSGPETARLEEAQRLSGSPLFADMGGLNERWKEFLDVFSNLIRASKVAPIAKKDVRLK